MGEKVKRIIEKTRAIGTHIFEALLDVIYPLEDYCIICLKGDCNCICNECIKKINKIEYNQNLIDSYGYYSGTLKELILKFKFKGNFTAGQILAWIMAEYIKNNYDIDNYILTYIPITKKTKKKRGFNQCEYIAKRISKDIGIECTELLIKVRDTKIQKTLSRIDRGKNIRGVFKINMKNFNKDKGIILMDDVVTTGETLMEANRILHKNGAKNIKLLTIAKSTI